MWRNNGMIELKEARSGSVRIVDSILGSLTTLRVRDGDWLDSEEEDSEIDTSVFKKAEAIRCFLIARQLKPSEFSSVPIAQDILIPDIISILEIIERDGFYPSPYSLNPGATDDKYTEFAAFCLDFCELAFTQYGSQNQDLSARCSHVSKSAISFLTNPNHYLKDRKGCRWGGTSLFTIKRPVKQLLTDAYFTSQVLIALAKTIDSQLLNLKERKKEEVRELIADGCDWIVNQIDGKTIIGNESERKDDRLVYTTWGIRALVETVKYHRQDYIETIKALIPNYIKEIKSKIAKDGIKVGQVYFNVISETNDGRAALYDDRTDWGGIFMTLVSLKRNKEFDSLLDETDYYSLLERVYNGILALRADNNSLWYTDYYIISIHHLLVEAYLSFDVLIKEVTFDINVTPKMINKAVKDTLTQDTTIALLQKEISRRLQEMAKRDRGIADDQS
jgi:hypothetical protein